MEDKDILKQIDDEYQQGKTYVQNRRNQFRDRIERYTRQDKQDDKINIHMISRAIDTLIASNYTDGLNVEFVSRDGVFGREKAQNLTHVAEFDMDEADYDQLNYQMHQDKYFFGVGIRLRTGWDNVKKTNKFIVINPVNFIPDPNATKNGKFTSESYRFFGFPRKTSMYDLIDEGIYDEDELDGMIKNHFSEEMNKTEQSYNRQGNYNTSVENLQENFNLTVYYHYTIIDWEKYRIVTDSDRKRILQKYKIPKVLDEEKKGMARRPLVLNYYKPKRNDFFGLSLTDELNDLEKAKSVLYNLSMIKARKAALWGTYLVNSRLIDNADELKKPSKWPRYIMTNEDVSNQNLGNAMTELPQENIKQSVVNGMNMIDREAVYNTGLDNQQLWIRWDKSITATESQTIQANSNLQMIKLNRVNMWGEKDFWKEWYKGYVQNFSKAEEKLVALKGDFEGKQSQYFGRDQFIMENDPYIKIIRKADSDALDEQQRQVLSQQLPIIRQDPNIPGVAKRMAQRMFFEASWFTPNQVNMLVPKGHHEEMAENYVKIINSGEKPRSIFKNLSPKNIKQTQEALRTYYIYIQQADNNDVKQEVLTSLRDAMNNLGMALEGVEKAGKAISNSNISKAVNRANEKWPSDGTQNLVTRNDIENGEQQ